MTSRSFAPAAVTAEFAWPLLRTSGRLVVAQSPDTVAQWAELDPAIELRTVTNVDGVRVLAAMSMAPEQLPRRSRSRRGS